MPSLRWIVDTSEPLGEQVALVRARLGGAGLADGGDARSAADLVDADAVVVWASRPLPADLTRALAGPTVRCLLAGPTLTDADPEGALAAAAGLVLAGATPQHDIRVRATPAAPDALRPSGHRHHDLGHVGEHDHLVDRVPLVSSVADDVKVLLTARVGLTEHPVLAWRDSTSTGVWTLGSTADSVGDRDAARMLIAMLRRMCGFAEPAEIGVGLLGYGAIGHEHSRAVRSVSGLRLAAVCDTSDLRLKAAAESAPDVVTTTSADELLALEDVDLVVVSTPPSTHAQWALRAIRSGRHAVVEKPFAIRTAEADEVLSEAADRGLLAVVYQNRRFDPDYVALRGLACKGALGEVFSVEAFVGGYGHPCNLWHSDEGVSGGAFYDWGSHVLDQILDLVPAEVEWVSATEQKRQWFDVTNADHSRVHLRFDGGAEAEFIHSDLAAALKPRWYVLGTHGAVVGHWRSERVVARNDIGTLLEDVLAPADSPPALDLHGADGSVTRVAAPAPEPYSFHRELADHLRAGLPMTVTGAQSRRVLAVMEAASESARSGGVPVAPR